MSRLETVSAAVAVILREDGRVLLGQRPPDKIWAGWWEFPGGKIEAGETPLHALARELEEELGIEVEQSYPWITRSFDYPERTVKLHFHIVRRWSGEAHGREGQLLSWQEPAALEVGPMLPANAPVLQALQLPAVYAISNLAELGEELFFAKLQQALANGLRLIQLREKQLALPALRTLAQRVMQVAAPFAARVLINCDDADLAQAMGADGIHLSSRALMALATRPPRGVCAASCHNLRQLQHAALLGLDFVVLSPVLPTVSHPEASTLGWHSFAQLIAEYPLPVYALGGMQPSDMEQAWLHGAHGIAMQRAGW